MHLNDSRRFRAIEIQVDVAAAIRNSNNCDSYGPSQSPYLLSDGRKIFLAVQIDTIQKR